MNNFLSRFLEQQKNILLRSLTIPGTICNLRSFEYSPTNDKTPNYTTEIHRTLYYLRYASSYTIEYYNIYKYIFNNFIPINSDTIRVLSIGCGAMLDLVGFYYALQEQKRLNKCTPYYYGVDLVDWECEATKLIYNVKFIKLGIENIDFVFDDIMPIDIIFFPKSISEISGDNLNSFVKKTSEYNLRNEIYIVNSRRRLSTSDSDKVYNLALNIKQQFGYYKQDKYILSAPDDITYWEDLCPGNYKFDWEIKRILPNLTNTYCNALCSEKYVCSKTIDKWPSLKTDNIRPEVYCLEKR